MHPLDPDIQRQMYIDQTRISHIVTDIKFVGNQLRGTVECAQTSAGKDMQGLIRQNSQVAFSMRGFGPVSEKKGDIVEIKSPLTVLCYDWVIHPSHPVAYMDKIIQESSQKNIFEPLTESAINDYILTESNQVKSLMDQLEIIGEKYAYRDNKFFIAEGSDILAVYLEDYITYELDNYLSKL